MLLLASTDIVNLPAEIASQNDVRRTAAVESLVNLEAAEWDDPRLSDAIRQCMHEDSTPQEITDHRSRVSHHPNQEPRTEN
jgi:hypothetical protein